MKMKVVFILTPVCIIILTVVIMMLSNPLLKPENRIRDDILKLTPIGSGMDEVLTVIEENNWRTVGGSNERGYSPPGQQCIGEKYKSVDLGGGLFTEVRSFWVFDEGGVLIGVYIEKYLTP